MTITEQPIATLDSGDARLLFSHGDALQTTDLEQFQSVVGKKGIHYRPAQGSTLSVDMRVIHRHGFCMADTLYGDALRGDVRPTDSSYRLQFGIAGRWREERLGHLYGYGPGMASLASPWEPQRVQTDVKLRRLYVDIKSDRVMWHLANLLDRPIATAPVLSPSFDLNSEAGRRVWRTVLFIAEELDNLGGEENPLLETTLEDYLIIRLLLALPHEWSNRLAAVGPSPSPRTLRRAIDLIHTHADEPLSVSQIANTVGVSTRTLVRHFQAYRGISPLALIRQVRMGRAHEDLCAPQPDDSVTTILHRWGFGHAGRFSVEYRKRYGERPSDTLRRSRH